MSLWLRTGGAAALLVAARATPLTAQTGDVDRIAPGSRVQIVRVTDVKPWTGTVVARAPSGLVVDRDRPRLGPAESVDWQELERLALGERRAASEGARRGAMRGFVIGALETILATGISVGSGADGRCDGCTIPPSVLVAAAGSAVTVGFTVGGALVGASAPGERWVPVRWRRQRRLTNWRQIRASIGQQHTDPLLSG